MSSVCLIIPPSPFLGDEKRQPPLGILYVAAGMERAGQRVELVDLRGVTKPLWEGLIPKRKSYGITATTPEYPQALAIARMLKRRGSCTVTLGGVHATALPNAIDRIFDCVFIGEYELGSDVDSIPYPARHLLPRESFVSDKLCRAGEAATTVVASRGCAFDCSFCSSKSMWGRHVRYRSVENVVAELRLLRDDYGIHQVRFHDDTLTLNRRWMLDFCEALKFEGIHWRAATRVDRAERELLVAMRDAGCYELAFGVEDPDQRVLDLHNKGIKSESIYEALATAQEVGIETRIYLMIGLPGQDEHTAKRLIKFIEDVNPTAADLSTFVPFPGSDVYRNPGKYGIHINGTDWGDYVFTRGLYGSEAEKDFIFRHDILSNESLKAQRKIVLDHIKARKLVLNA